MKLLEALNAAKAMQSRQGETLFCFLAAGFSTLHLKTFLTAELSFQFPERKIEIGEGVYGDLAGNLDRLANSRSDCGVVVIEWPDLDPRLGLRSSARWSDFELADILATARARAVHIEQVIERHSRRMVLGVCFPTLPVAPFSFSPGWQANSFEIDLRTMVQSVAAGIAHCPQIRIVSPQRLELDSPLKDRLDVGSESFAGFPYRMAHASVMAACLAQLLRNPSPRKGLITDLDETLWRGILGEDGIDGISWDLEHHSQMHAFYQRFLGSLASSGVFIGVASKNDHSLVEEALRRDDLALSPSVLFPVEAHWNPKSQSVARILETWNIGADSVVFIDDSPLELAEVKTAHPQIECLQFPTKDSTGIYNLALRLRDIFGKTAVREEDAIRIESIRRSHTAPDPPDAASAADFFRNADAEVTVSFSKEPPDPRALDLVNKTNQFNLNGKRHTEASWSRLLTDPTGFVLVASYRDKFGPLGKIAVLAGSAAGPRLTISSWVMSCRAFSRRIEYRCLAELLGRFEPAEVEFAYVRTDRNSPLQEFLSDVLGTFPSPGCVASRQDLEARLNTVLNLREAVHG